MKYITRNKVREDAEREVRMKVLCCSRLMFRGVCGWGGVGDDKAEGTCEKSYLNPTQQ